MLINRLKLSVYNQLQQDAKNYPFSYQPILDDLEENDKVINLRLETIQYLVVNGNLKSSGEVVPLWYEIELVYNLFK